jgi:hypothetical protein
MSPRRIRDPLGTSIAREEAVLTSFAHQASHVSSLAGARINPQGIGKRSVVILSITTLPSVASS